VRSPTDFFAISRDRIAALMEGEVKPWKAVAVARSARIRVVCIFNNKDLMCYVAIEEARRC
jgi:hypothetical protein